MQRIEELNELDMELYDYARDLFQQRYQFTRQQERRQQRLKNHHQGLGLGVSLWPSKQGGNNKGAAGGGPALALEWEERDEAEENGGRTEEAGGGGGGGSRLPTEDYMNQIINRW